jgi:hypothetical protein
MDTENLRPLLTCSSNPRNTQANLPRYDSVLGKRTAGVRPSAGLHPSGSWIVDLNWLFGVILMGAIEIR